jgi:hypothetical protein
MYLENGWGDCTKAKVKPDGSVVTYSITEDIALNRNGDSKTFSINVRNVTSTAGGCVFYMKNNTEHDIVIKGWVLNSSANEEIEMCKKNTITTVTGTDIIPVCLNSSGQDNLDAEFKQNCSGVTKGIVMRFLKMGASAQSMPFSCSCGLIIGKNDDFAVFSVDGGSVLNMSILMIEYED